MVDHFRWELREERPGLRVFKRAQVEWPPVGSAELRAGACRAKLGKKPFESGAGLK